MMATQDVAHRDRVDVMPQVRQSPLDASTAPGGILVGHADNQLLDFLGDTRSTKVTEG
jgi:hypothetical protein